MRPTTISIVIPHYGDPSPTRRLVDSLLQQDTTHHLQIVVSDDASPTPCPDWADVQVVHRPVNGGFGSAVNFGAERAAGQWLMILNSDLTIGPAFVEDWLVAAKPWGDAITGPRVLTPAGDEAWTGRHFPTIWQQFTEWLIPLARWRHLPRLHEAVGHDTHATGGAIQPVDWVMGAAMLLPTTLFRAVGGFDEHFHMNAEEVDLQRRLRDHGIPAVYLGTVSAEHEGGGSSASNQRRQWLVTARMRYADKWAKDGYPGGRHSLVAALRVATIINLVWNCGRRLAGADVRPYRVFRYELSLLNNGGR